MIATLRKPSSSYANAAITWALYIVRVANAEHVLTDARKVGLGGTNGHNRNLLVRRRIGDLGGDARGNFADNRDRALADQALSCRLADFRSRVRVFDEELDLLTADATLLVDLVNREQSARLAASIPQGFKSPLMLATKPILILLGLGVSICWAEAP